MHPKVESAAHVHELRRWGSNFASTWICSASTTGAFPSPQANPDATNPATLLITRRVLPQHGLVAARLWQGWGETCPCEDNCLGDPVHRPAAWAGVSAQAPFKELELGGCLTGSWRSRSSAQGLRDCKWVPATQHMVQIQHGAFACRTNL